MSPNARKALALMLVGGGLTAAVPAAVQPAFAECNAERIDCALKANKCHPTCIRQNTKSTHKN